MSVNQILSYISSRVKKNTVLFWTFRSSTYTILGINLFEYEKSSLEMAKTHEIVSAKLRPRILAVFTILYQISAQSTKLFYPLNFRLYENLVNTFHARTTWVLTLDRSWSNSSLSIFFINSLRIYTKILCFEIELAQFIQFIIIFLPL